MELNKLVSEEDVKKALKIDKFSEISKDKLIEFISLIPYMDRDIAKNVIEQFPTFAETSRNMVAQLYVLCEDVIKDNNESRREVVAAYRKILDDLGEIIKCENITEEERGKVIDTMVDIADKIANIHENDEEFLKNVLRYAIPAMCGTIMILAATLGVKVKSNKIPHIS